MSYRLPKPAPQGGLMLKPQPLELIGMPAVLMPPPRSHRNRYHRVLAPNSPGREQIIAKANEQALFAEALEQV